MHRHFDWTAPGALLVAGVVTGVACGTDARNPVAPDVSARSGADGTAFAAGDRSGADANVCHRKGRGQDYVPIAIPSAAVESHLAHGDGLVGGPVPGSPRMTFDVACTPVLREAVITFSDLATHGAPFTSYDESGLTVVATQGDWEVSTTYGNPEPFVVFPSPANVPVVTASVTVTASGAQFTFSAVDVYSSLTPIPYMFTGIKSGVTVFTVSNIQPNTFGGFATVQNPYPNESIDTLLIALSNPADVCCPNSTGLDNIAIVK